jgi:MFS family permease
MLLPSSFTMFAAGMLAGRLTARFGGKALVVAGCAVGAGSMAILAFAHAQQWEIYVSTALMGVGFGLAFSAMSALIVGAVPSSQTGVASGMNANIRTIGGSIGAAAMASIVTSRLLPSGLPAQSGYTIGFAAMTGGLVLAALAGLLIPVARRAARASDAATYPEEMATTGEAAATATGTATANVNGMAAANGTAGANGAADEAADEAAAAGDR